MTTKEENETVEIEADTETHLYSIALAKKNHDRIKKVVFLRKAMELPQDQIQSWVMSAIIKRLDRDMEGVDFPLQTQISLKIPAELDQKIHERVEFYKKISSLSFSKKKWLLAAIEEQLEEDEELLPKRFMENNKK